MKFFHGVFKLNKKGLKVSMLDIRFGAKTRNIINRADVNQKDSSNAFKRRTS